MSRVPVSKTDPLPSDVEGSPCAVSKRTRPRPSVCAAESSAQPWVWTAPEPFPAGGGGSTGWSVFHPGGGRTSHQSNGERGSRPAVKALAGAPTLLKGGVGGFFDLISRWVQRRKKARGGAGPQLPLGTCPPELHRGASGEAGSAGRPATQMGPQQGWGKEACGQSRDWTAGSRFPSQSCFPAPPGKGREARAGLPDQRRRHQGGRRVRCALDRDRSLYRAQPGSSQGWEPWGSVRSLLPGALPHSGGWATPRRVCSAFPNRTPGHTAPPRIVP